MRWIDSNKGLFDEITILESIKNVGTCKNLGKAFRSLKTEFFLVIAGDDVISKQNVFRKMDIMEDCDVLLNSIMMFKASDLSIIRNKRKYLDAVIQCCESRRFIKWISGVGCPIQNGAIYRTSLLTEDVLQYMEKFHILDDRTRFYAIFKQFCFTFLYLLIF